MTLLLAAALYATGLWIAVQRVGWDAIQWTRYPVMLPTGLLALSLVNSWLRSRALGWGIFALAFVLLVVILGAFVVQVRLESNTEWVVFGRAMALYAALCLAGLFQLRAPRRRETVSH